MPSALPHSYFTLLGVYNGDNNDGVWPNAVTNNPRGTIVNDDISINNFISGLLVSGNGGHDRITLQEGGLQLASIVTGNDQIFGNGAVLNTLNGGDGNDYIHGGGGVDRLSGGTGNDTLSYEFSTAGVDVNMSLVSSGNIAVSGGDADGDTVINDFENVVGSNSGDSITGNGGNNVLIGLDGNDSLYGDPFSGAGDDTLLGGAGNDTLQGDLGSDIIIGGPGADTMFGYNGIEGTSDLGAVDTFRFMTTDEIVGDLIGYFSIEDKIDLSPIDPDSNSANGNGAFTPGEITITETVPNPGGPQDTGTYTVAIAGQSGVLTVESFSPLTINDFIL